MAEKQLVGGAPVLLVKDVAATAEYYEDRLGFKTNFLWGDPADYGIIERDNFSIHLLRTQPGAGRSNRSELAQQASDMYIFVADVDALYAELVKRSADVLAPPQTWPYQMREFVLRDINGYYLAFGQFVGQEAEH